MVGDPANYHARGAYQRAATPTRQSVAQGDATVEEFTPLSLPPRRPRPGRVSQRTGHIAAALRCSRTRSVRTVVALCPTNGTPRLVAAPCGASPSHELLRRLRQGRHRRQPLHLRPRLLLLVRYPLRQRRAHPPPCLHSLTLPLIASLRPPWTAPGAVLRSPSNHHSRADGGPAVRPDARRLCLAVHNPRLYRLALGNSCWLCTGGHVSRPSTYPRPRVVRSS